MHRTADARSEAERTEEHPERDADDDTERRRAGEVVDEHAQERAADDAAGEKGAETEQVAATEGRGLEVVWHRPKLPQHAAPRTGRMGPGEESRIAVVNIGGRSVSKGGNKPGGMTRPNARERYHERALPLKWIDQGRSGPSPASGPWAGCRGVETFGSRKVSARVTTTITASTPHIHGPV